MQQPRGRSTPRRRDRRGRGLRGPLCPPQVPLARTRSERFDGLVLDAVERLERSWGDQLREVEFAVEDVPPEEAAAAVDRGGATVPLGRAYPARPPRVARIVVYRRPVERRAPDLDELSLLVHDVVVEQVAELLGLEPADVDRRYGERDDG